MSKQSQLNNLRLSNLPILVSKVLQLKISQYHKHSESTLNGLKRDDIFGYEFSCSRKVQWKDFSFECVVNRFVSFVGCTNLILQGYGYLRRKVESVSEFIVEKVVECYTVKALLLSRYISNPIQSLITDIQCFLYRELIGLGRVQLYFYSSFEHIGIISAYRKILSKEDAAPPHS